MFALILLSFSILPAQEKEQPKSVILLNKTKDIRVVAGKDEPILDYFRGHRILVGTVLADGLKKIVETKKPLDQFFVNYASHNDGKNGSTFGAFLLVAAPSEAVVKLLNQHRPDGKKKLNLALILRRDDKNEKLYHVVGCTDRPSVGFFDNDKKNDTDGFSQKELRHRPKK
jgi:hypothetical protein